MNEISRKILKISLRIVITSALLVLVLRNVDLDELILSIKNAKWQYLLIIFTITTAVYLIRSVKMHSILQRLDCEVSSHKIFAASAITSLYSFFLPGMLSTGVKWFILKKQSGKGSNVFSGMVYNQATEICVSTMLGLIALLLSNPAGGILLPVLCITIAFVMIVVMFMLFGKGFDGKLAAWINWLTIPFPSPVKNKIMQIAEQIGIFKTLELSFHVGMIGYSFVATVLSILIFAVAAQGAMITVPTDVLVWQCSLIFLLSRLPLAILNLGPREYALVKSLEIYNIETHSALVMSMLILSTAMFMAILGAIYQIIFKAELAKRKPL